MIHLYTGNGKGKTTAAVGLGIRAAGRGKKVIFAQFMKGNDTGELHILERLPQVRICRSSKGFGFYRELTPEQKEELTGEHNRILDEILTALRAGECDLAILDEVTYPIEWKLLEEEKLMQILEMGKGAYDLEVAATGRDPAPFLWEMADYITEMQSVRHPYEKGVLAREGIEY